jgi:hypothetical protein
MSDKGFFGSLFDFSFESFVFPKIIRVLYWIAVVVICLAYLAGVVYGFGQSTEYGVAALFLGPVVLLLYLIIVRVWMEVAIVLFRIYENTDIIARR